MIAIARENREKSPDFGIGIVFGPHLLPYLGQNFALKRTKD
ncbi:MULTISPECIES: hypothetical protein [unclassified Afipia]|nr:MULTISPECIES: hypothetical protein [unclassified Afipia]